MKDKPITVRMGPVPVLRCKGCGFPVVKKTAAGRFLLNGKNLSFDPTNMIAAGKCPRCEEAFSGEVND